MNSERGFYETQIYDQRRSWGEMFDSKKDQLDEADETSLIRVVNSPDLGRSLEAKVAIPARTKVFALTGQTKITEGGADRPSMKFFTDEHTEHSLANAICIDRVDSASVPGGNKYVWRVPGDKDPLRWLNHSCDPNTTRVQHTVCSIKQINPGEPITIDYSLLELNPDWEMPCRCGAPNCRGKIKGVSHLSPQQIEPYWANLPRFIQDFYLTHFRAKTPDLSKLVPQSNFEFL